MKEQLCKYCGNKLKESQIVKGSNKYSRIKAHITGERIPDDVMDFLEREGYKILDITAFMAKYILPSRHDEQSYIIGSDATKVDYTNYMVEELSISKEKAENIVRRRF